LFPGLRQAFGSAIKVNILADKACIDSGIEVFHIIGGGSHLRVIGDVDEIDGGIFNNV
jgi:hypothetical protein